MRKRLRVPPKIYPAPLALQTLVASVVYWVFSGVYFVVSGGIPKFKGGLHIVLADRQRTRLLDLPAFLDVSVQCVTILFAASGCMAVVCFAWIAKFSRAQPTGQQGQDWEYLWPRALPMLCAVAFVTLGLLAVANRNFGEWQPW